MVDKRHAQQRSGSPQGNPDAAHPSNPSPPATELGGVPAVWQGGEVASHFAPNAIAHQKAELWYPQVLTIPAGSTVNVSADGIPARWLVSLASAGTVTVYTIANGAGVGLPLYAQGVTLRLPGTNPQLSLQNTGNATATVVVIATSGYQPIEALGYVSGASAASGGAGSNVTIVGPVNGSGFVEVAQQGAVAVTGTFFQATQPVSGTVTAVGGAATGAVPVGNPVLVAGFDGTDVRDILTDASGHIIVVVNGTVPVTGTFFQTTQPVSVTPPSSPVSGQTPIVTANTAVQFAAHALVAGIVQGYANPANVGNVFIGPSGVTSTNGLILAPGKPFFVFVNNTNTYFVNGANVGDGVSWTAS